MPRLLPVGNDKGGGNGSDNGVGGNDGNYDSSGSDGSEKLMIVYNTVMMSGGKSSLGGKHKTQYTTLTTKWSQCYASVVPREQ